MVEFEFLKSLVIILGLSAIVVFILDKFKVPTIIGFLTAGIFLGPHGLELIENIHLVNILAEIGVILLLFTIGLEFSLKKILSLRKTILLGGLLQVFITSLLVFLLAHFFGLSINASLVFGFLISLSSTAIVMKMLLERAEIDSPHGRASIGILIFQDLCVVPFLLIIPLLSGSDKSTLKVLLVLLKSSGIVIAVLISARWLVPKILHQIVRTRKRELFVISIIFICLGAAFLTSRLGLSLALGAFIAGLIISESEYSYQAISDILPFKESFNGLFFISVGMLLNLKFFFLNISDIGIVVIAIILLKTLTTSSALFLMGCNLRISLHTAIILSQIGEFSFVLSVAALKAGILNEGLYQLFLSSSIITMILTPFMVSLSPRVSGWVTSQRLLKRLQKMREHSEISSVRKRIIDHVIIIGYGFNGKNLSLILKELEVSYVILEMNNETVIRMRKEGEPIYYGDGINSEILHRMGIEKARILVITISDPSASRKIVRIAREMNPHLYIVVRTRYIAEVEELHTLGADEVIPEEFETSIELFSSVLMYYQMPKTLIEKYSERLRKNHYRLFIKEDTPKKIFHDTIALMPEIESASFLVKSNSPANNNSLRGLNIRAESGALVLAIKRDRQFISNPLPDFLFNEGDIVFVIGDSPSLERAKKFFNTL